MEYMISRLRNILESSEGWTYTIWREISLKKVYRPLRRMTHLEDSIQKGDHQNDASHKVPHLQSFFNMIQESDSKSQMWCDRIQKRCWWVEKLVNHQTAAFLLLWYFQRLKKKATSSLSSLRPVDQRSSRLKICTLQRINFWSL